MEDKQITPNEYHILFLKYRKYLEECEQNLHQSNFAKKVMRIEELKTQLHDLISKWHSSGVNFCLALDENGIFADKLEENGQPQLSSLLSHLSFLLEELDTLYEMLNDYSDEYFKAGIPIEEKIENEISFTEDEYASYAEVDNKNPLKDRYDINIESLLKAKCYVDVLSPLTENVEFSLVDEINKFLLMLAKEFNLAFSLNPNSYDKTYLKYNLMEIGSDGLQRLLYDPAEARKYLHTKLTRFTDERALPEEANGNNFDNIPSNDI